MGRRERHEKQHVLTTKIGANTPQKQTYETWAVLESNVIVSTALVRNWVKAVGA